MLGQQGTPVVFEKRPPHQQQQQQQGLATSVRNQPGVHPHLLSQKRQGWDPTICAAHTPSDSIHTSRDTHWHRLLLPNNELTCTQVTDFLQGMIRANDVHLLLTPVAGVLYESRSEQCWVGTMACGRVGWPDGQSAICLSVPCVSTPKITVPHSAS